MCPGDKLLHIFSHHIKKTEDQLRDILCDYMLGRLQWVERLTRIVLKDANVSVEDYIDSMSTPGISLDFCALVVLCRIYHIHVTVYTTQGLWATCRKKDIRNCLFGIIFNGSFQFMETVKIGKLEQYTHWLDEHFKAGKLPSHEHLSIPAEIKSEAKLCSVPKVLSIVNNSVLCGHGHLGIKTELKQEPTVVNYVDEALEQEARSSQEFGDNESTHEYSEDGSEHNLDNLYQSPEPMVDRTERDDNVTSGGVSVFPKPEPIGSGSEMNDSGSDTSDDDCQILKCHETVPLSDDESAFQYRSEIKIEALWEKVHECVSAATGAVLQKAWNRSECASTSETPNIIDNRNEFASTSEMSNIIEILDDLLLSCPVCEYIDKSQKKCVCHITDNHPDYRFKCWFCTRDFANFHTKYRHEREHQPPTKFCTVCGKGFYFQSELNKHVGVHSEVLPYGCTTCGKCFAQAKSLG